MGRSSSAHCAALGPLHLPVPLPSPVGVWGRPTSATCTRSLSQAGDPARWNSAHRPAPPTAATASGAHSPGRSLPPAPAGGPCTEEALVAAVGCGSCRDAGVSLGPGEAQPDLLARGSRPLPRDAVLPAECGPQHPAKADREPAGWVHGPWDPPTPRAGGKRGPGQCSPPSPPWPGPPTHTHAQCLPPEQPLLSSVPWADFGATVITSHPVWLRAGAEGRTGLVCRLV